MTPRAFTAGWLVSAVVLSSWAVSSASDQAPPASKAKTRAEARGPAVSLPPLAAEVEAEVDRLSSFTRVASGPAAVPGLARNPFSFGSGAAREAARAPRAAAPGDVIGVAFALDAAVAEPPAPVPSLSGVADAAGDGVLTAVISFRDELHFVKKGDVIAGRYRVEAIRTDGADIFDLTLGTILRLSLHGVS